MQNLSGWSISQTRSQSWTSRIRIRGETFALLGCYAAYIGNFRRFGITSVHSSRASPRKISWPWKMEPIVAPKRRTFTTNLFCVTSQKREAWNHTKRDWYEADTGLIRTHQHYLVYITARRVSSHTYGSERDHIDMFICLTKLTWERACVHVYSYRKCLYCIKCSVGSFICSAIPLLLPQKLYRIV